MTHPVIDLDELDRLRRDRRLRLVPTQSKTATDPAQLEGDPDLLVRELVRLARLGQTIEMEGDHGRFNR